MAGRGGVGGCAGRGARGGHARAGARVGAAQRGLHACAGRPRGESTRTPDAGEGRAAEGRLGRRLAPPRCAFLSLFYQSYCMHHWNTQTVLECNCPLLWRFPVLLGMTGPPYSYRRVSVCPSPHTSKSNDSVWGTCTFLTWGIFLIVLGLQHWQVLLEGTVFWVVSATACDGGCRCVARVGCAGRPL